MVLLFFFYLRLENKDVFDLIRRYDLYGVIHKMLMPLIQIDQERAFQILLDKNKIPPEIVVQQLESNQEYLYLVGNSDTQLINKNPGFLMNLSFVFSSI